MDKRRALLLGLNIGIVATSLLAAFFTSTLLLSVVGLRVQPGTPSWSLEGESLRLSVPLQLMNAGPRDVENLSIESSVKSGAYELGRGATGPITVKAGEGRTLTHTITVPLRGIPENVLRGLLLEDQSLDVQLRASLGFTPLAQVQVLASLSLPWGAPLGNLQVGRPEIQPLNATHIGLSVPFSFTNRSPYVDIDATVRIMVLDEAGRLLGQGFLTLLHPGPHPSAVGSRLS